MPAVRKDNLPIEGELHRARGIYNRTGKAALHQLKIDFNSPFRFTFFRSFQLLDLINCSMRNMDTSSFRLLHRKHAESY